MSTYHDLCYLNNVYTVQYAEPYFFLRSDSVLLNYFYRLNPVYEWLHLMMILNQSMCLLVFYRCSLHRLDNECKKTNRHVRAEKWLGYQNQTCNNKN